MGIKGIYKELGPGKRVALSKLTADSFEHLGRPLRLAIDIAIWQFQTQAAKGGTNPAIRTLFYRLTRLQSLPVQPIFVFDGPHKPKIKRNKRSGRGDGVATAQAKRLIRLFGFPIHDAPGEAEAECALLQRHGIVDAVLSEDVDTIMFGCTKTLRSWSAEGKGNTPTHVTMYNVDEIQSLGLDREGMVLVALMSGGDYLPDGIPGCGVKVAVEAAKAGYGKRLCRLKNSDAEGIAEWKKDLMHELRTNESRYFRCKHAALAIPEKFPDMEVLRLYTHPVVTKVADLDPVRQNFEKKRNIEIQGLREFGRETFDWDYKLGAIKFIRVISQSVLLRHMMHDPAEAAKFVTKISSQRNHASTGESSELRLSYVPGDLVPVDLSLEVEENVSAGREGLALDENNEDIEALEEDIPVADATGKVFDVTRPELIWVLESLARVALPEAVSAWDVEHAAKLAKKAKSPTKRKTTVRGKKQPDAQTGAMDAFVKVTKNTSAAPASKPPKQKSPPPQIFQRPRTPPLDNSTSKQPSTPSTASSLVRHTANWSIGSSQSPSSPRVFTNQQATTQLPATFAAPAKRGTTPEGRPRAGRDIETIVLSSSPPPSPSPARRRRRRGGEGCSGGDELPGLVGEVLACGDEGDEEGEGSMIAGFGSSSPVTKELFSPLRRDGMREKMVGVRLKQTSMEEFMRVARARNVGVPSTPRKEAIRDDPFVISPVHNRDDPIVLSSSPLAPPAYTRPTTPPAHASSSTPASPVHTPSSSRTFASSPPSASKRSVNERRSPSPGTPVRKKVVTPTKKKEKKKLLVPRASMGGFFKTVEVDEEEREERERWEQGRLDRMGRGERVVRVSEVGVIDLTELD